MASGSCTVGPGSQCVLGGRGGESWFSLGARPVSRYSCQQGARPVCVVGTAGEFSQCSLGCFDLCGVTGGWWALYIANAKLRAGRQKTGLRRRV